MIRRLLLGLVILVVVGFGIFWVLTAPKRVDAASVPDYAGDPVHGRMVFFAGGCASCHMTPGQQDPQRLGGGAPLRSPFGTFYAPNISPDPEHGIGRWTPADFLTAVHDGVSPAGEHLYPAFPYTTYTHMRAEDALDLFAFLKTLPAETTQNKPHDLPFPFNIRRTLGIWKLLFLHQGPILANSSKPEDYNRGAYLVGALAHCAECHSPRNVLGAIIEDRRFSGGTDVESGGWVPNITPGEGGIGDWSADEIAEMLKTGFTPGFDSVGGSMAEVVRNTSQLGDDDRRAIAVFIKGLPPRSGTRPPPQP